MAKNGFENGAVIRNENNEFLCTENGNELFWENDTEFAICFKDNQEAEDFLNRWNREHPENIIASNVNGQRIRIEESNCQCGKTRTPIASNDEFDDNEDVSDDIIALAAKILASNAKTAKKAAELDATEEELQEAIKQKERDIKRENDKLSSMKNELASLKKSLKDVKASQESAMKAINSKLDAVFTPETKKKVLKKLFDM